MYLYALRHRHKRRGADTIQALAIEHNRKAEWMHRPGMRKTSNRLVEQAREIPYPRIYFARAIDGEGYAARSELTSVVAAELASAGLSMVDPTAEDDPLEATGETNVDESGRYRTIVEHDLSVLRSCHAVLMDISTPGRSYIGCICEMTYAYLWKIPCVVYMGRADNRRPWLQYHATAVFETRADAIGLLCELLYSDGRVARTRI